MEPEKFENGIKKILQEREIKPAADSWNKLEQRLEHGKRSSKPYFLWVSAAAAIAVVFFLLGSYFTSPIPAEIPQIVEETPETPVLQEKVTEPEVLQVIASEEVEAKEEFSAETPAKNDIFEAPVSEASTEEIAQVSEETSEAASQTSEAVAENYPGLVEEIRSELAAHEISREVTDTEIEALLLLATAELETQPRYSVNADDLLHQVEYELEQSFRQKVFEVVREGLLKAKTAVANRDF